MMVSNMRLVLVSKFLSKMSLEGQDNLVIGKFEPLSGNYAVNKNENK